jgi:hypothetical protein
MNPDKVHNELKKDQDLHHPSESQSLLKHCGSRRPGRAADTGPGPRMTVTENAVRRDSFCRRLAPRVHSCLVPGHSHGSHGHSVRLGPLADQ